MQRVAMQCNSDPKQRNATQCNATQCKTGNVRNRTLRGDARILPLSAEEIPTWSQRFAISPPTRPQRASRGPPRRGQDCPIVALDGPGVPAWRPMGLLRSPRRPKRRQRVAPGQPGVNTLHLDERASAPLRRMFEVDNSKISVIRLGRVTQ